MSTSPETLQTLAALCWKKADQLLNLSTRMMEAAEALQEESESYAKQAVALQEKARDEEKAKPKEGKNEPTHTSLQ